MYTGYCYESECPPRWHSNDWGEVRYPTSDIAASPVYFIFLFSLNIIQSRKKKFFFFGSQDFLSCFFLFFFYCHWHWRYKSLTKKLKCGHMFDVLTRVTFTMAFLALISSVTLSMLLHSAFMFFWHVLSSLVNVQKICKTPHLSFVLFLLEILHMPLFFSDFFVIIA